MAGVSLRNKLMLTGFGADDVEERLVAWDRDVVPYLPSAPTSISSHAVVGFVRVLYEGRCSLYGGTDCDYWTWHDGRWWVLVMYSDGGFKHMPTGEASTNSEWSRP